MMLWSVQSKEFYNSLSDSNIIYTDGRRVIPYFRKAYKWMVDQMNANNIETTKYPIWAYHTYNKERKKPDLRKRYGTRGESLVLIEFSPPEELVLLSDFNGWHSVLNNSYHSYSEQEDDKHGNTKSQSLKEKSWLRIFDLTGKDRDITWTGGVESIQACVPYLNIEWITAVKEFTSR